jgi:NitT/TauT family transport system substrate-binding protein
MKTLLSAALALLVALAGPAAAQDKRTPVKIAIGGASCLCYLPTVLAKQLGEYQKAGLDAELINFKGGSVALTAVLGGSADVVSGYFDHTVNIAAKNKIMTAITVYDHLPALVLVVAPKFHDEIKTIKDLDGKKVGVSAPGSSTDFFLKFLLRKAGVDPAKVASIGVGQDDTAMAAIEQGQVHAMVNLDPAITMLQRKHKEKLRILADTRTQKDTRDIFGSDYPGGSLYVTADWLQKNEKTAQGLADAMVATLRWIHAHSAEEIMAKMPKDLTVVDPETYLAALKNIMPIYSKDGRANIEMAQAVHAVFAQSVPEIANAKIDLTKTFTNKYVDEANKKLGGS